MYIVMTTMLIKTILLLLFSSIGYLGCVTDTPDQAANDPAIISLDTNYLHTFTKVSIRLQGAFDKKTDYAGGKEIKFSSDSGYIILTSSIVPVRWQGTTFNSDTSISWESHPTPPYYREDESHGSASVHFTGSIDAKNQISGSCSDFYSGYGKNHWGTVYENYDKDQTLKYSAIPHDPNDSTKLVFRLQGRILKDHIPSYYYKYNSHYTFELIETIEKIQWDSLPEPKLEIIFTK